MTPTSPCYTSPVFSCELRALSEGATLLALAGDLDLFSVPEFQDIARPLVEGGCRRLVVDLGSVEFVDSAGLAALMLLYRHCQSSHCELALVDATGRQENLFALTGLDQILPLSESAPETAALH